MALKTTPYRAADYLESDEDVAAYLEAALETGDAAFFQKALGTAARARGMKNVAEGAGTTRAGLYKALSGTGNPEFATILRVLDALGYRLSIREPAAGYAVKSRRKPTRAVRGVRTVSATAKRRAPR
jgi:probable addiction module antidote protein